MFVEEGNKMFEDLKVANKEYEDLKAKYDE